MIPTVTTEERAPLEAVYILQLIGFSSGALGCILLPITVHHSDWRLWFIEKNRYYVDGVARLGIWKICFPPSSLDQNSLRCCHDFDLFEVFFPMEMKLGQIMMLIGSVLAFWGLLFAFLVPWNTFFQKYIQSRWLSFVGGTFFVISSICVIVPMSWNVYSVLKNEGITFPSSFHLPTNPVAQRNGGAIYLGYMSGFLLFVSGFATLLQVVLVAKIPAGFRSGRISSV